MRYKEILEAREMNFNKALEVFSLTKEQFDKMSDESLKSLWKGLVKKMHPDNPENKGVGDLASVNAAYDSLKLAKKPKCQFKSSTSSSSARRDWEPRQREWEKYNFSVFESDMFKHEKRGNVTVSNFGKSKFLKGFDTLREALDYLYNDIKVDRLVHKEKEVVDNVYEKNNKFYYINRL